LPLGLNVTSEIFQNHLIQNNEGLKEVICIVDDLTLFGVGDIYEEALQDHDRKSGSIIKEVSRKKYCAELA
jgi:hypothetical protein